MKVEMPEKFTVTPRDFVNLRDSELDVERELAQMSED
jgi:hypothetical protein